MARLLSAITLTWAVLQAVHAIPTINKLADFESCSSIGSINPAFDHFNGIFFGQFSASNEYVMYGPLASRGTFYAPIDIIIDKDKTVDCTMPNSLEALGLVVGAEMFSSYTTVYGSAYLSGAGDARKINQLSPGCTVRQQREVPDFHFPKIEQDANDLSARLAAKEPTLRLDDDSTFKRVSPTPNGVEVITFNTCFFKNDCSNFFPGKMSDSSRILEGSGNWAGVQGAIQPEAGLTYVMNIPVMEGNTFYLSTYNPTVGFNGCKLIMHYYPVRASVGLSPESRFYLNRKTSSTVSAFTLAPRGDIREDNNRGRFGGTVIGLSYVSVYTAQSMLRYKSTANSVGGCDRFSGCLPLTGVYTEPANATVAPVTTVRKTIVATTTALATTTVVDTQPTTITAVATSTVIDVQPYTVSVTNVQSTTITAVATTTVVDVRPYTVSVTSIQPVTITVTKAIDHLSTITRIAYETIYRERVETQTLSTFTQTEYQFFYTDCDIDS